MQNFSCNSTYVHNWKQYLLKCCLIFLFNGSGRKRFAGTQQQSWKAERNAVGGGQLLIFLQVIYSTARLPSLPQDYEFMFAVL
jgi:hypothetical protein